MSVAENAGTNAIETTELSLNSTENFYYKQLIPQVSRRLQNGATFYSTFKETEQFPQDVLIYIDNGETAGELAAHVTNRVFVVDVKRRAELLRKLGYCASADGDIAIGVEPCGEREYLAVGVGELCHRVL